MYEDGEIVVIDKPAGMVVNRAATVKTETVQDWMRQTGRVAPADDEYFCERDGLVHRLDKETSGVMVLAKTAEAFAELLRQFKQREVQKEYLALTHGIWSPTEGEINLPLGRRRDNRQLMGVKEGGRESITEYRVVDQYRVWKFPRELKVDDRGYTGFSLVKFWPKTGRMHQIRVHARHLGHPLVSDSEYAGRKRSREDRKWAHRVMLQAQKLEFTHPKTKERVVFESSNPEFRQILEYLTG